MLESPARGTACTTLPLPLVWTGCERGGSCRQVCDVQQIVLLSPPEGRCQAGRMPRMVVNILATCGRGSLLSRPLAREEPPPEVELFFPLSAFQAASGLSRAPSDYKYLGNVWSRVHSSLNRRPERTHLFNFEQSDIFLFPVIYYPFFFLEKEGEVLRILLGLLGRICSLRLKVSSHQLPSTRCRVN